MKSTLFAVLPLSALLLAGCASTQVRPDEGADAAADQPNVQVKDASGEKITLSAGMKKPGLHENAVKFFNAMETLPGGGVFVLDFDAFVRRGLVEDRPYDPNGYSLVQMIVPWIQEASAMSSGLAAPLAEGIVYASLLDRTIDYHDVKRFGLWWPRMGSSDDELNAKKIISKAVMAVGMDGTAADGELLISAMRVMSQLLDSSEGVGPLAKEAVQEEMSHGEDDGDSERQQKAPDISAAETLDSLVETTADGLICFKDKAQQKESQEAGDAKEEEAPPEEAEADSPMCAVTGDGYYAVGHGDSLRALVKASKEAAAQPGSTEVPPKFIRLGMSLTDIGAGDITLAPEENGDVTLRISALFSDEERLMEASQFVEMGLARRAQAQGEMKTAVAIALQNTQKSLSELPNVPAKMKQAADAMTADSVLDPFGTKANDPANVTFSQDGNLLRLTLRTPASQVEHNIATMKNAGMLRYRLLVSALGGLAALITAGD